MNTEVLIRTCHKCYDYPPRPARPIKQKRKGNGKKECFYELGRLHGEPVVFEVYPQYMYRKVPYRYTKKKHKGWIYIPELEIYRSNENLTF